MIARYRLRDRHVMAVRYSAPSAAPDGDSGNAREISHWADGGACTVVAPTGYWADHGSNLTWALLVGGQVALPGDWIVRADCDAEGAPVYGVVGAALFDALVVEQPV